VDEQRDQAPARGSTRSHCLRLALVTIGLALAFGACVAGWAWWSARQIQARIPVDTQRAIEIVVKPDFVPDFQGPGRNGVMDLVVNGSFDRNYEVLEEDCDRIRSVLEPRGDVVSVEAGPIVPLGSPPAERPAGFEMRCTLTFADESQADYWFSFSYRQVTLASWATLRAVRPAE
jgi:hypothetical protein